MNDKLSGCECVVFVCVLQLVMEYCLGSASDLLEGKCVCKRAHTFTLAHMHTVYVFVFVSVRKFSIFLCFFLCEHESRHRRTSE